MQYRKFGKLDWNASVLGFGCMRFPTLEGDHSKINYSEAGKLLEYAIDHGLNYLDTAYVYHRKNSEIFLGDFLKSGLRQKVKLATKMPGHMVKMSEDFDKILNEQLQKLQTETIDFYLLHGLNKQEWEHFQELNILEWIPKALSSGRIQHMGFSFHDKFDVLQSIIDAYDWDFCQVQYNYMDVNEQAGIQGLKYAASKGLAVVVMEPLLGGLLATAPEPVQKVWDQAEHKRKPADWALQWLWNQPEVTVVLSGMNAMQQVQDNIASADRARINSLTENELQLVDRVRDRYREIRPIPCTKCGYCMPCPNGVNIPDLFDLFNGGAMFEAFPQMRNHYRWIDEKARPNLCVQCRECESKCPQNILVSEWMVFVNQVFGEGKEYSSSMHP